MADDRTTWKVEVRGADIAEQSAVATLETDVKDRDLERRVFDATLGDRPVTP